MTETAERPFETDPYPAARKAMLENQLRPSGVNAPAVLSAMGRVPRERYLPEGKRGYAYMDRSIRLDDGAMAAPVVYGLMLQEAAPTADDRVLVVDNGSGYLTALVEPMVASVQTVSVEEAAKTRKGDFTLIMVDGAVEEFPANLAKRLADNGRVVTGLVERGVTRLASGVKAGSAVALLPLADLGIPELPAFRKAREWSF